MAIQTSKATAGAVDLTPVERPQPIVEPVKVTSQEAGHLTELDATRAWLAAQPRVRVRIRKEDGRQFCQINGVGISIQPGEWVEIAQPYYELLVDAGVA